MVNIKAIAVLLILAIGLGPFDAVAQTPQENKVAVKEQLGKIPLGSVIEVKLLHKGSDKITGKLVSVADESFEIQTTRSGKLSNEKIAFGMVKSVKKRGMRTLYKALIWTGVVAAGVAIAGSIVFKD